MPCIRPNCSPCRSLPPAPPRPTTLAVQGILQGYPCSLHLSCDTKQGRWTEPDPGGSSAIHVPKNFSRRVFSPPLKKEQQRKTMPKNNSFLTTADLQLQFILDASPVGMLIFNDREEIIAANPLAERLFAISSETGSGQRCGDFIRCANRLKTACGLRPCLLLPLLSPAARAAHHSRRYGHEQRPGR